MKLFRKRIKIKKITDGRFQKQINRDTIIIHHYCPHTFNIGDHFVIKSIRKHLKENLPEALFIPKACAKNRGWGMPVQLKGENINQSNQFADAVIIGGSDQYNNWSLRIKKDEITKLNPPLYLIGLGISSAGLDAPPKINKHEYLDDIRQTNITARYSSVRDKLTQKFLESLGIDKTILTGCPAMYLYDEPFHFKTDGYAALTFPFPVIKKNKSELYSDLIARIENTISIIEKAGLEPVISCHDDRDVFTAQSFFPERKIFFSNYVDDFVDFYRNAAFVVGSRLHASIFVSGLGKPFININIDKRGLGFSETFNLVDWNLNINDTEFSGKLEQRIQTILKNDLSVFENFYALKSEYKNVFKSFISSVADDIRQKLKRD
ncbi:MAG: polysaccharide pyruvyl transferase family protein [Calditrichae bacterium]|nr:polysaccharide pyruvyl transferase family protein [Calditrichota bacterium]MCB9057398.1 polysaccharide pyruvyl transferase family protein [Calditrichia bacterium]